MTTFDIYFNSGTGSEYSTHYEKGDNVSLIEITYTEQDYYPNGTIELFNTPTSQIIGNDIRIFIDDTQQFTGYVARVSRTSSEGTTFYNYQLVGKTYDLWRYGTTDSTAYSGMTSYIASSLISTYCPGISGEYTDPTTGVFLDNELDLSNVTIGECLIRLTDIDGYKFYVDDNDQLHYYDPGNSSWAFTITDEEIFEHSPIEEADEDLVNDILVLGASEYATKISQKSTIDSFSLTTNTWLAQRFTAADSPLSAIKLYFDRTTGDNVPDTMKFYIYPDSDVTIFLDDFDNNNYLNTSTDWSTQRCQGALTLEPTSYDTALNMEGTNYDNTTSNYVIGFNIKMSDFPDDRRLYSIQQDLYAQSFSSPKTIWCVFASGGTGIFSSTPLASTSATMTTNPQMLQFTFDFEDQCQLYGGQNFAIIYFYEENLTTKLFFRVNSHGSHEGNYDVYHGGDDFLHSWVLDKQNRRDWGYTIISWWVWDKWKGSIESINTEIKTRYMTISAQIWGDTILFSGSNDGGSNWVTLNNGVEYDFGSEGDYAMVKYIFTGTTDDWQLNPPYILKSKLATSDESHSAGEPSRYPLEWSDDITISPGDLPYPSGWTSWQTYTQPKLALTEGVDYWIVISGVNYGTKHWDIFYSSGHRYYKSGNLLVSHDLVNWYDHSDESYIPSGDISFELGYNEGVIEYRASSQSSKDLYGTYFKIIRDSTLTTEYQAKAVADRIIEDSLNPVYKGDFTINGRTDVSLNTRFSSNLEQLGFNRGHNLIGYTHRIDKEEGFTTKLQYGKQPYDIVKKISDLEVEVYGSD